MILFLFISFTLDAKAQIKEFVAINGVTYHLQDTIHLGTGTAKGGKFLYITLSGLPSIFKSSQMFLDSSYAYNYVIIKRIVNYYSRFGRTISFTVGVKGSNDRIVSINSAIKHGEVLPGPVPDPIATMAKPE